MKKILNILADTVDIKPLDKYTGMTDASEDDLGSTIGRIISSVIGILGLACVIIIIIGGVQYMTSSGDSGKVKIAKDTILYGVIGMVICVLAFAITQFVIGAINA